MNGWIAIVFPKDCPPAYLKIDRSIVWDKALAHPFHTREEALDAATEASFEGETIGAEYYQSQRYGIVQSGAEGSGG